MLSLKIYLKNYELNFLQVDNATYLKTIMIIHSAVTDFLTLNDLGSGLCSINFRATGAAYPGPPKPERKDLESMVMFPILPFSRRKLEMTGTFFFPSLFTSSHRSQGSSSDFWGSFFSSPDSKSKDYREQ